MIRELIIFGGMAKLVYALDLKSKDRNVVWVQIPFPLIIVTICIARSKTLQVFGVILETLIYWRLRISVSASDFLSEKSSSILLDAYAKDHVFRARLLV